MVHDGKLVYDSCFGLADLETKAPVTDSAMLKWQVNDLRHYFENDLRFLREFNTALEV